MATLKIGNFPQDADIYFTIGDTLIHTFTFTADADSYEAGFTDELGNEITDVTCTVDAGVLTLSLTADQTAALPVNGRTVPIMFWYLAEVNGAESITIYRGRVIASVK